MTAVWEPSSILKYPQHLSHSHNSLLSKPRTQLCPKNIQTAHSTCSHPYRQLSCLASTLDMFCRCNFSAIWAWRCHRWIAEKAQEIWHFLRLTGQPVTSILPSRHALQHRFDTIWQKFLFYLYPEIFDCFNKFINLTILEIRKEKTTSLPFAK